MATPVDGTLIGRGGGLLIIDDPLKANDAASEVARQKVIEWFSGTAISRLDRPGKSKVIVVKFFVSKTKLNVVGRHPKDEKQTRLLHQQERFEAGRVLLPPEALWLADFEKALFGFPLARHDDQVDVLLLLLEWFQTNESKVVLVGPMILWTPKDPIWFAKPY